MTEYEILDLVGGESAQSATQFTLYLSVLFAYLVTAYFVGERLTRAQVFFLSGLYIFVNLAQAWGMVLTMNRVGELMERKAEISPLTEWEKGYVGYGHLWAVAMVIGLLASLYFMWNVRHPKTELQP